METTQRSPDPKLKEDPNNTGRNVFVLKFKTDEDMQNVLSLLRKDGGFSQKLVNGEILTIIRKEQLIELNKNKELQYEVW